MTEETLQEQQASQTNEGSFMLPIWMITLVTMLGTTLICYAWHTQDIAKRRAQNMEEVAKVEFRTEKYTAYKTLIDKEGKAAAIASLNKN
jgi:hypothetical protein